MPRRPFPIRDRPADLFLPLKPPKEVTESASKSPSALNGPAGQEPASVRGSSSACAWGLRRRWPCSAARALREPIVTLPNAAMMAAICCRMPGPVGRWDYPGTRALTGPREVCYSPRRDGRGERHGGGWRRPCDREPAIAGEPGERRRVDHRGPARVVVEVDVHDRANRPDLPDPPGPGR